MSNDVKTDLSGNHFVKGGLSDPDTPAGAKWLTRHLYSWSGTAPKEYDQYFLDAANKYNVDPRWLKAIAAGNLHGTRMRKGLLQGLVSVH